MHSHETGQRKIGVMEGELMESCVCWRAGGDGELLRSRCDGELGVIESYCGFGVM